MWRRYRGAVDRLCDGAPVRMHVHPRRDRRGARRHHAPEPAAGGSEGTVAYTLAALKDWTFLLGPGWVVGWGNGLILGYMMYRSQLVPRPWPWLGMIGGPLLFIAGTIVMFGGESRGTLHGLKGPAINSRSRYGSCSSASTAPSGASAGRRRSWPEAMSRTPRRRPQLEPGVTTRDVRPLIGRRLNRRRGRASGLFVYLQPL